MPVTTFIAAGGPEEEGCFLLSSITDRAPQYCLGNSFKIVFIFLNSSLDAFRKMLYFFLK